MEYFSDCSTLAQAKKKFRELVFVYHPDKGGKTEDMQNMLSEYEEFLKTHKYNMHNFSKDHDFLNEKITEMFFDRIKNSVKEGNYLKATVYSLISAAMILGSAYEKQINQTKTKFDVNEK